MLLGRWTPIEPSSRPRPELFAALPLAGVLPRLRFRPRPMDPTHHPSPLWRMLRGHLATAGFLPRRRCPMRLLTLVQAMSLSEVSGIHPHLLVPRRLLLFSLPHRGRRLRLAGILPRPSHLPTYPLWRTHGKPFIRHGEHRSLDVIWLGG